MADDGHERLPNMGPGNLLPAQHACLRYVRWSHFQPISSSLAAQPWFLIQDAGLRDLTACPRGIVPPISKPPPHNPAVGPVAARRGWDVTWTALLQIWESLASFPACPQHLFSPPHKGKPQDAWLRVLRKSRFGALHRILDGKFARAGMYRALLSHLEWELQAPDYHIKRCQILWVCLKRKRWLNFQRKVGQKSTPGCRPQADSRNSDASSFYILPWKNGNYWLVLLTYCTGTARGRDQNMSPVLHI